MRTDRGAFVFRIRREGSVVFTALSNDVYSTLLQSLDGSTIADLTFAKAKELQLSQSTVGVLTRNLVAAFKRKLKCDFLLLEMLDSEADEYVYDDLCEAVHASVREQSTNLPWCICIAVSNEEAFKESLLLRHRLIPACQDRSIGLILLPFAQEAKPEVLCQGGLSVTGTLGVLWPSGDEKPETPQQRLSPEEIEGDLQQLFGHFEITLEGSLFHVPSVASVKRLASNSVFVAQLKHDVSEIIKTADYSVQPFGIPGGGIIELSLNLAGGDTSRIVDTSSASKAGAHLILCDFVSSMYPIEEAIDEARQKGITQLAVAAVASYQDAPEVLGVPNLSYLETNHTAVSSSELPCRFCKQDVSVIPGDHFESFSRGVKEFDPFTFWEFASQSEDFLWVGHWASDRTPNHYHFRIMTEPIFKRHCYDMSVRLRNVLASRGILPGWVKKIVCTEGEQSTLLSRGLSEVLGLRAEDVVRIPRRFFASIAGKQLDPQLLKYIDSKFGEDNLRRRNVLIVDEAAHHFRTLSALRDVCEFYDCDILAFAVFIDRTHGPLSLGEYLHDSNFVALYSWPVPPHREYECPCIGERLP